MFENKNFEEWWKQHDYSEFHKYDCLDAYNTGEQNGYNKVKEEMQEQIEKMKCCENCKNEGDYKEPYRYGTGWCNICKRHKVAKGNFDKWEIKENDSIRTS